MKGIKEIKESRRLKKERRRLRWSDPYKVSNMSDEDLFLQKKKILKGSILRICFGFLILAGIVVFLIFFWNDIFYSPGRWFF